MSHSSHIDRRKFLQYTGLGLSSLALGTGLLGRASIAQAARSGDKVKGVADPGWHGICYLDGAKHEYLVDPKLKNGNGIPIYIFSSEGFDMGPGPLNPLGCLILDTGEEVCYLPNRLQNNVFDGNGTLWRMFKAEGVGLYARVNGTTLYSTGNPDHIEGINLLLEPFRFADDIFAYTDANNPNGLVITDLGMAFNCPLIDPDGHPVMDLNPGVA